MHKQNDMTRFGYWATLLIPALGFSRYTILSANIVFLFSNCYAPTDCFFFKLHCRISPVKCWIVVELLDILALFLMVVFENALSAYHYDDVKILLISICWVFLLSVDFWRSLQRLYMICLFIFNMGYINGFPNIWPTLRS